MKKIFTFLAFLSVNYAFSQTIDSREAKADLEGKTAFNWDAKKAKRTTLLTLKVPYQREGQDSAEYLTLTVAKKRSKKRPSFISLSVPDHALQHNGMLIKFGQKELERGNLLKLSFDHCTEEYCTARIIGGYVTDEHTRAEIDVFQKFLEFEHVYFLFIYPNGSHKTVAIPLSSFQEQYKKLEKGKTTSPSLATTVN